MRIRAKITHEADDWGWFCRKFRAERPGVCLPAGIFWGQQVSIEFKGSHFERDVILWGVRWYVAYPISYRQLEEMMEERGVEVDHSTLQSLGAQICPGSGEGVPGAQASSGSAVGDWMRPM